MIFDQPSAYHDAFVVLPLSVKVNDPEVDGPDEHDVQHGVIRSRALQNHLVPNHHLRVFRRLCDSCGLYMKTKTTITVEAIANAHAHTCTYKADL